jgi:uncharacterized membrane protein
MTMPRSSRNPLVRWPQSVAAQPKLDPLAARVTDLSRAFEKLPRFDALARGAWLGHSVHPALTDLPIGFWTSAMMVDLVGGPSSSITARRLIAWGNVSAIPTALAGLADVRERGTTDRRVASVHGALNAAGLVAYVLSWLARRGPQRRLGIASSFVGATLLTVSAHLGGHLVLGTRDGENTNGRTETGER